MLPSPDLPEIDGPEGEIAGQLRLPGRRLVDRSKVKKLALVAAARKLLDWAWAVFISGYPFDATKTVKLTA
jgi:hypothetical protein